MFVLISTTCALICVGALAWWLVYRSRTRILLAGLPSLNNGCFIKDLYMLWGDSQNLLSVVKLLAKRSEEKNYLPLVTWFGPVSSLISFSDPDDAKSILNTFLDTPFFYDFAKCLMGNGLITAPVSTWKQNYKKFAGSYTTGSLLNSYQKVFCAQAHALVQKLKEEAGREPFDIQHKYLDYTSLAAIYQITVNQRLDKVNPEVCKAYNRSLALFVERGFNPLYYSDFVYRLTPSNKELMGYVKLLNNLLDMEIEERTRERDETERNGSFDKSNGKSMDTFLDKLLELSETDPMITKQQIMDELNTMVASGLETVSITLTILLILIGNKRDIQDKMYDEIKEIFGDGVRQVEKEDLPRMRYCEAVINETLRLYPAVPMVLRNAGHELQLECVTVPKGAICGINVLGVNRSKRLWGPDADEFRPERWLEDRVISSATFISFGYGKRMCTGSKYAMTFLKTMLAYCIRELKFESEGGELQLKLEVSLKTVSGHLLRVQLHE